MVDILIRNVPDDIATRINELAKIDSRSREVFLRLFLIKHFSEQSGATIIQQHLAAPKPKAARKPR